jgi:PiT family inorganic phosphate transporter
LQYLQYLVYVLAFVVIALVSGNNLPACTGSIISSNIISRRKGLLLTILGYSIGFIAEGSLLRAGISSIMPVNSYLLSSVVLFSALVVFLFAHKTKVPQSLSITMSMAILGLDLAIGAKPNLGFLSEMLIAWILTSILAIWLSYSTMKHSYRFLKKKNIWRSVSSMKTLLIMVSFFTAFTLGANTLGFVYALMPHQSAAFYVQLLGIVGIMVGSIFLSRRELSLMGSGIVSMRYLNSLVTQSISALFVELATFFSIPLSNTQMYVSSIYGSTISYKTNMAHGKSIMIILRSWLIMALISIAVGYIVAAFIA